MLRGNVGEWSEMYVLLRLLADGKIYAADDNLNKLKDIYFPIIKIIREEMKGQVKEYNTGEEIKIYLNGLEIDNIPSSIFHEEAHSLLNTIKNGETKGAFSVERTEKFMDQIGCLKLSAPSRDKSDITVKIIDINTGHSPTIGFSIKSELGSAPTLLNAGKTTNFVYKIIHQYTNIIRETNEIYKVSRNKKHTNVRGRIENIIKNNGTIMYIKMQNKTFKDNLILFDSRMDELIAQTLLYFYKDGISNCNDMIKKLEEENPMKFGNVHAYSYKFKKFLTSVALGMRPATEWNGIDEASGGYIIVTREGNVLAYHIYNRNHFENYLLNNTKYETASTSRHDFGELYEENGETHIKLNLQIRFK